MSYGIGTIFLFLRPLEAKAKALSIVSYLARKPDLQQKNSRCSPMSNLKKPTHTAVCQRYNSTVLIIMLPGGSRVISMI